MSPFINDLDIGDEDKIVEHFQNIPDIMEYILESDLYPLGALNEALEILHRALNNGNLEASKNKEYQKKMKEFNADKDKLSDFLRKEKENELTKMQVDLKQFQLNAQKEINQKKAMLYQKAIDKLKKAINEVARENDYRFIIDNSEGVLLYFEAQDNVEPLVKKKLGIK